MKIWMTGLLLAASGLASAASAQIAVSANDGGKVPPADAPDTPRSADTISVLDIGEDGGRVLATLPVPATVTGPPGTVAVSRDSRMAIVTAGQVVGADGKPTPGDVVTVVDISRPAAPRVVQTLRAGVGAAGVVINAAGTLALVANTAAGSVSAFTIAGGRLTPAGTVALDPKSRPVDVAFAGPNDAYVLAQGTNNLIRLSVKGATVTATQDAIAVGAQPYSLTLDPRTRMAYVTNLGGRAPSEGRGPKPGSIGIVDLAAGRMVDQIDTGLTPEYVGLSPSRRYLVATVQNGSGLSTKAPGFNDFGLLTLFRVDGKLLIPAAETRTGRWCQGAAWRRDEKMLLLQCSLEKKVEAYRFDGSTLTPAAAVTVEGRPGAIATAQSR